MTSRIFFNLLFSLSLSGSLLFGIWLCFRYFLKKKITKRFQYNLLLVVIARLLIPLTAVNSLMSLIYSRISATSFYQSIFGIASSSNSASPIIVGENVIIGDNVVLGSVNPYGKYLFISWFLVFFFLIIQKITKYQSFIKYIRANWVPVENPNTLDLLSSICEKQRISTVIELYTTPLVSSPLLFGLRKSYIVLPDENLSEKDLYSILLHEVTHYKQHDLLFKWLVQVTVAIHWFNPVIYYLQKVVNSECEYACDETAISDLSPDQCFDYGNTLIAMAKRPGNYNERVASVTLYESNSKLKKRLSAIIERNTNTSPNKFLLVVISLLFILGAFYLGAYYS